MNRHQYKNFTIEVIDEPTYQYGSADNTFNYSKHYFRDNEEDYAISKHGIKVYSDDQLIYDGIIMGLVGATGIQPNSSLVDNDCLLICCCDTIFCLTLPDLNLKWKTRADQATCFEIYKYQDSYIIHGELEISRLDKDGKILWQQSGADIFTTSDGKDDFVITDHYILATDWENRKYKIDFNGQVIQDIHNKTYKIQRECSKCGHKDEVEVSKRDAAFELVDINDLFGKTCSKCSSARFTTYYQSPNLDYELLKEWATNSELFLMEQDEELLLAEERYLDLILQVLDNVPMFNHKRNLLMDALCIIVYENSDEDSAKNNINLKKRVIEELNKRTEKLELADEWIMDYIKKIVYPQLKFEK